MSLFDFFKRKPRQHNITMNFAPTSSGTTPVSIDWQGIDVYASDIVMQSIRCKANEFRKLQPRHVRNVDGRQEVITTSSVAKLLRRPNTLMTQSEFFEKITILLELNKNVYIYPEYYMTNGGEKVFTEMYPLRPAQVDMLVDSAGRYFYRFTFPNGVVSTLPASDIIHWRKDYGVDEYFGGNGWADNASVKKAIGYYDTMLRSIAKALDISCNVNGILKINSYMSDDKVEAEIQAFKNRIERNESGILASDMKTDYTHIPRDVKLVDAETVKFLYENIIRANGTSLPILSGDYTKAQKEAYYEHALEADIKSLGEAMSRVFFTDRELGYGNSVVLYPYLTNFMSMENKLSALQTGLPAGLFTVNEGRALLGYPPVEGGDELRPRGYNNLDGSGDGEALTETGGTTDTGLTQGEEEDIKDTAKDVVREPLLVGQLTVLTQIVADYQAGMYTYNQAVNMLVVGVGITKAEAEQILDKQNEVTDDGEDS